MSSSEHINGNEQELPSPNAPAPAPAEPRDGIEVVKHDVADLLSPAGGPGGHDDPPEDEGSAFSATREYPMASFNVTALTKAMLAHAPGARLALADAYFEDDWEARGDLLRIEERLAGTMPVAERQELEDRRRDALEAHQRKVLERYGLAQLEDPAAFPERTLDDFAALSPEHQVQALETLLRLPEQFSEQDAVLHRHASGFLYDSTEIARYSDPLHCLRSADAEHRTFLLQKFLQGFTRFNLVSYVHPLRGSLGLRNAALNASGLCNMIGVPGTLRECGAHPYALFDNESFGIDMFPHPLEPSDPAPFYWGSTHPPRSCVFSLVEDMPNMPSGDAPAVTRAGRPQIMANTSALEYENLLRHHPSYRGELPVSIESQLCFHLYMIEIRHILPDYHDQSGGLGTETICSGAAHPAVFPSAWPPFMGFTFNTHAITWRPIGFYQGDRRVALDIRSVPANSHPAFMVPRSAVYI